MQNGVSSFRFVFLGTGTSGGIPIIACDCPACTSDDPRDHRTRQGAAVRWTDARGIDRTVLIDATPDLRMQAFRHDLRRCDAILFTHNHVDHIFGLDEVRRFNAVMQAPIDIYAEPDTMESLRRVYRHVFEPAANLNKSFVAELIAHPLAPGVPVDLFGVRFLPIRLLHGRQPIVGFRIELAGGSGPRDVEPLPLAYCTDTSGIPPETWAELRDLDTLVLDGLRIRHHPTHFNIDQACEAADRIGARQTWLIHLAHEIVHAQIDPELPEGVNLAYDGLVLGDRGAEPEAGPPVPPPSALRPAPIAGGPGAITDPAHGEP